MLSMFEFSSTIFDASNIEPIVQDQGNNGIMEDCRTVCTERKAGIDS